MAGAMSRALQASILRARLMQARLVQARVVQARRGALLWPWQIERVCRNWHLAYKSGGV